MFSFDSLDDLNKEKGTIHHDFASNRLLSIYQRFARRHEKALKEEGIKHLKNVEQVLYHNETFEGDALVLTEYIVVLVTDWYLRKTIMYITCNSKDELFCESFDSFAEFMLHTATLPPDNKIRRHFDY